MLEQSKSGTPFVKVPIPRDLALIFRSVKWFLGLAGATLLSLGAYAAKGWVQNLATDQTTAMTLPLMPMVSKVSALEDFRDRQEKQNVRTNDQMFQIYLKVTALEASQAATKDNTDRILRRLDGGK